MEASHPLAIADYLVQAAGLPSPWRASRCRVDEVAKMVLSLRREAGIGARQIERQEIIERLVFPIINEAALCLAEGIARRPEDVDLAMVFGTGFAPFRGGPLRYAESIGIARVVEGLTRMSATHPHLAPSEALIDFAKAGSFNG